MSRADRWRKRAYLAREKGDEMQEKLCREAARSVDFLEQLKRKAKPVQLTFSFAT